MNLSAEQLNQDENVKVELSMRQIQSAWFALEHYRRELIQDINKHNAGETEDDIEFLTITLRRTEQCMEALEESIE